MDNNHCISGRARIERYDGPIPGHIAALSTLAATAGWTVRVVLRVDEEGDGDLVMHVNGATTAFRRSQLLPSRFCFPVRCRRIPYGPFLGKLRRSGDDTFSAEFRFDVPTSVQRLVSSAVDEAMYDGPRRIERYRELFGPVREVERAADLPLGKLERGKRAGRGIWGARRVWHYPSGLVWYRESLDQRTQEQTRIKFARKDVEFRAFMTRVLTEPGSRELQVKEEVKYGMLDENQ